MAAVQDDAVPQVVLEATSSPSEEADATATTSSAGGTMESSGEELALDDEAAENFINGPIQLPYVFTTKGIPGRKRFRPYTPPTAAKAAAVAPADGDTEAPPAASEGNAAPPRVGRPAVRGGLRRPVAPSPELTQLLATKRTLLARRNQLEDDVRRLKLAARCADPAELDKLEGLAAKWKKVVQRAATELQEQAQAQSAEVIITVGEILTAFQVDRALVGYHADSDSFE